MTAKEEEEKIFRVAPEMRDGGTAFPAQRLERDFPGDIDSPHFINNHPGMSKRELVAMSCMEVAIKFAQPWLEPDKAVDAMVKAAFMIADAFIKFRQDEDDANFDRMQNERARRREAKDERPV